MNKDLIARVVIEKIASLKHSKLAEFLYELKRRPATIKSAIIATMPDLLKRVQEKFNRTIQHISNFEVVARHAVTMLQRHFANQLKTA